MSETTPEGTEHPDERPTTRCASTRRIRPRARTPTPTRAPPFRVSTRRTQPRADRCRTPTGGRRAGRRPRRPPPAPSARPSNIACGPRHSVATTNSVRPSGPPRAHEKQPRSTSIVCSTSPPSRTRTQCRLGTSAYQTAPSASRQIPSGHVGAELGPDAPVGQAAVRLDVEGGEPVAVRLGDDERGVVGGDRHAVGEPHVVGDLAHRAARRDHGDGAAGRRRAAHQVEAGLVDVGVAAPVDDDLVPRRRQRRQVGVRCQRRRRPRVRGRSTRRPAGRRAASRSRTGSRPRDA